MAFIKTIITFIAFCILTLQAQTLSPQGEFTGAVESTVPNWFKQSFLDLKDDVDEANDDNRLVMIYFHQNGCPYCAQLINVNFKDAALVKKIRQHFDAIEINIWGDKEVIDLQGETLTEKTFSEKIKVQFTPTLLFLDENGKIIMRLNGYHDIDKMHTILDYIIQKEYKKQSLSDYQFKQSPSNKTNDLPQSAYFDKPPFLLIRSQELPASKPLTVIFTKSDCQKCVSFYQQYIKDEANEEKLKKTQVVQLDLNNKQTIVKPNGDKTTAYKWYQELQLTDLPAMVFFNEQGQEIIRKDAFLKVFHLQSVLDYVANDNYKKFPNFQRFIEHRAETIRNNGQNVNIWE